MASWTSCGCDWTSSSEPESDWGITQVWRSVTENILCLQLWTRRPDLKSEYSKQYFARYLFSHTNKEDIHRQFFTEAGCCYQPQSNRRRPVVLPWAFLSISPAASKATAELFVYYFYYNVNSSSTSTSSHYFITIYFYFHNEQFPATKSKNLWSCWPNGEMPVRPSICLSVSLNYSGYIYGPIFKIFFLIRLGWSLGAPSWCWPHRCGDPCSR